MGPTPARRIALALAIAAALAPVAACGDDGGDLRLSVRAEVVDTGAPVSVEATEVGDAGDGRLAHDVRVTWEDDEPAVLDDARFTHIVEADGGYLVTAGRGCGASWDEDDERVVQACTDDLQLVWLEPRETHPYPVTIHPEVGPRRLEPGTYTVEETIRWALADEPAPVPDPPDGEFTVRLTYDVE